MVIKLLVLTLLQLAMATILIMKTVQLFMVLQTVQLQMRLLR